MWSKMVKLFDKMHEKQIVSHSFLRKKFGNGSGTSFWKDVWLGDEILMDRFLRLYALEVHK